MIEELPADSGASAALTTVSGCHAESRPLLALSHTSAYARRGDDDH
jgi:hypothetical protein